MKQVQNNGANVLMRTVRAVDNVIIATAWLQWTREEWEQISGPTYRSEDIAVGSFFQEQMASGKIRTEFQVVDELE